MSESAQIFQTTNPSRWQRLKWGSRIVIFLLIFAIAVITLTLRSVSKSNDKIPLDVRAIKKVLSGSVPTVDKESSISKYNKGFKYYIHNQWVEGKGVGQKDTVLTFLIHHYLVIV